MSRTRFEWDPEKDIANQQRHGVSFGLAQFAFAGSSEPGIGERESVSMTARIRYTDEPLGRIRIVPDFLPRPEDLVFRDDGVKITISLSKRSVEFFKQEAGKHKTQYQRMIRRLLDAYAEHHSRPGTPRPARTRARASRAG